jgi:predicted PurR-regulated permease PerM
MPPMSHYARATLTVVIVLALVAAAWAVRNILLLVLVAAVLAVGLDPSVRRLQGWGLPRGLAVATIFLAAVAFVAGFGFLVIPPLVSEVRELAQDIPGFVDRLARSSSFFGDLQRRFDLSERLRNLTENIPSAASASFGAVFGVTRSVASVIFNLITIAILTIYFLLSLPRGRKLAEDLLERDQDDRTLAEALERVGGYVSGNITISIIAGVVSYVALRIIGVPFAAALAMWVAVADLIPTVGATLGAVVAVIVAAFAGLGQLIATAVFFVAYQQAENYFIAPRVMKRAVDLSPAAVIVSVLIGGSLAGLAGALLALPMAAAAKVVVRDLYLNKRLARRSDALGL